MPASSSHGYKPRLSLSRGRGRGKVRGGCDSHRSSCSEAKGTPLREPLGSPSPGVTPSGPPAVSLREPSAPEAVGYLTLRLLNLGGRHGHPVLQMRQRLVRGPGGLHGALGGRGALFPSVCLARRRAHLGQERLQASPTRTSPYHHLFSSLLELGGQAVSQGLHTL